MNLSSIAVRRPVFTVMVTVALLVLGFVGYGRLGTDLFPDVSFPVVAVNIVYPGAGPSEVETLVSKPVEDAVVSLNGLDRVRTLSREGLSTTIIFFKLGVDISDAATQVRERVAQTRYKLPADVKEPTVNRFDVSAAPILTYTLRGNRPLSEVRKFADDVIRPALEQVDGVASVDVRGGAQREVHVDLDRAKLRALNLDAAQVSQKLRAENLTVPAGRYDEGTREISVRTVGEFTGAEAIRDLIVATRPTQPGTAPTGEFSGVRLRDVAVVEDGYEELRTKVRANGEEAVAFDIVKQSGENTVAIADAVKERLGKLEKTFPPDLRPELLIDQSRFIKGNVDEVKMAIFFGGAMAILIILIFMLDLRSTVISSVALPTSVIGTFFLMYVLGYSLNMMTLLGLSLAIGLLIDDAVVVRENIFKHLERGKNPFQAALDGTKEIALSVLATTLTIVAVFMPVAFVKGMVGQFFRQFGITISGATLLSLFVAFTLDPMLSSRFSKALSDKDDRFAWLKRPFEAAFRALDDGYRATLGFAMRWRKSVGLAAVGTFVFVIGLMGAGFVGCDFMTPEDHGQFYVNMELPAGTALAETSRLSATGEKQLLTDKEFKVVFATIGPSGDANKATWRIVTTSKEERAIGLQELKDRARVVAAQVMPGAKVSVTDPPIVEGAQAESPIIVDVRGATYDDIGPLSEQVAQILRTTAGVQDVQVRYTPGRPEVRVSVDRQRAADLGVSVAQVAMTVRTAMEGEEATKLRQGKDEIPVRVRMRKEDRENEADLGRLTLMTPKGPVQVRDLAKLSRGEGPQVIEREDRSRQIQVWASMKNRALGDIVREIQPKIAALPLPAGASIKYDGQIRMMSETNENMGLALLLGVVFIYIVLASQFESFIHPLTIMLTLPLALVGAVLALFLTGNSLSMSAFIGIILLMGLVTKNAILLIDRAIVRVRELGEPPLQAIMEAGPERLRPILMTSAAMVLGMLPTALGKGEGSEFRAPMAIAVIGGVVSSTLLSLIVVPVFYMGIEKIKERLGIGQVKMDERRTMLAAVEHSGEMTAE